MPDLVSGLPGPASSTPAIDVDPGALAAAFGAGQSQQPTLSAPEWFKPVEKRIRQAEGTAGGSGNVLYGGQPYSPSHDFPDWPGATGPSGQPTHAAGPGQWEPQTWQIERKIAARKGVDLDFSNPSHQSWAMYDLASRTYRDHTGRDLEADQKAGTVNMAALSDQWEGVGSRNPAAVHRELQNNMFGAFNGDARAFSAAMIQAVEAANDRYDAAMRKAEQLSDFAAAASRKMLLQAMQPPRNNH
jgi:hypothetical protein